MLQKNCSLKEFNSFNIDANAARLFHLSNENQLSELVSFVNQEKESDHPVLILGGGSNILFCEDFNGLVIKVELSGVEISETADHFHLKVGAGENWHDLVERCTKQNIRGLENLALIPGVVGAAPVQNIGAYGVEFEQVCESVEMIDLNSGKKGHLTNEECDFAYRHSIFKTDQMANTLITSVTLKLPKNWIPQNSYGPLKALGENVTAEQIFTQVCQTRMEKLPDPTVLGNAGSFFKNPIINQLELNALLKDHPAVPNYPQENGDVKLAAGWLIDQANLKGFQIGGAAVHQLQALVLINKENAIADDVLKLAWHVRETVNQKFGVQLEHEVRFMNKHGETNLAKEMLSV